MPGGLIAGGRRVWIIIAERGVGYRVCTAEQGLSATVDANAKISRRTHRNALQIELVDRNELGSETDRRQYDVARRVVHALAGVAAGGSREIAALKPHASTLRLVAGK